MYYVCIHKTKIQFILQKRPSILNYNHGIDTLNSFSKIYNNWSHIGK